MSTERSKYSSSLLTAKEPYEATETIRIRLSEAKLVNKSFYLLLKEVSDLKQNYNQQLRKIISQNENLSQSLRKQMVETQVLTREEMSNYKFNSVGEVNTLWSTLINALKADMNAGTQFQVLLQHDSVSALKSSTENDSRWTESRKLHSKLTQVAASIENSNQTSASSDMINEAHRQWSLESPYLFELFENLDHDRLEILKNCLLSYQTGFSDYLLTTTNQCETDMAALLSFEPEAEIDRFTREAVKYNFQLSSPAAPVNQSSNSLLDHQVAAKKEKRRSTFGNLGQRFTSNSTVLHHDLMNNEFSDSNNNQSLKSKKSSSGLKSKVGSIFGRNKLKNKKSQNFNKLNHDTITEANSNTSSHTPTRTSTRQSHSKPQSQVIRTPVTSAGSDSLYKVKNVQPTTETNDAAINHPMQSSLPPDATPADTNSNNMPNIYIAPRETSESFSTPQQILQPQQINKNLPIEPVSPESVNQLEARPLHIQAPIVPPSRKQVRSSQIINSVVNQQPPQDQPSIPEICPASILLSQVTPGLKVLDPQSTGTSNILNPQSLFQHANSNTNSFGLNASVAEVINATFKDGVLTSSQLIGEVALSYLRDVQTQSSLPIGLNLKIENGDKFEKVILNQAFIERVSAEEYKVNPQFIVSKTLGAIKYSINEPQAPIVVHPAWKFESHQASVVLTVKIAPTVPESIQELTLQDFSVIVSIDGAEATNALSKPQGSFSKEKKRIAWRFKEPLVLKRNSEERLIARFITDSIAHETSRGVIVKFTIQNNESELVDFGSSLQLKSQETSEEDPFNGDWNSIVTSKTLTAGNYYGLSA